jgi:ATP-dependent helicase HrpA
LPDHVVLQTSAGPTMGFPGLRYQGAASAGADQKPTQSMGGQRVDLAVFSSAKERDRANRLGFAQLALTKLGKPAQFFRRELAKRKQLGLYFASMGDAQALTEQCLLNVAWYCYFDGQTLPGSDAELDARLAEKRGELAEIFNLTLESFETVLKLRFDLVRGLDALQSPGLLPSAEDIRRQVDLLVPKNVLEVTPWRFLPSLPYYLQGLDFRLNQLRGHVPKDRSLMAQVEPLHARLMAIADTEMHDVHIAAELHFFVQELRLKLFAEPIALQKRPSPAFVGPDWKVSLKRVDARLRQEEQRVGLA